MGWCRATRRGAALARAAGGQSPAHLLPLRRRLFHRAAREAQPLQNVGGLTPCSAAGGVLQRQAHSNAGFAALSRCSDQSDTSAALFRRARTRCDVAREPGGDEREQEVVVLAALSERRVALPESPLHPAVSGGRAVRAVGAAEAAGEGGGVLRQAPQAVWADRGCDPARRRMEGHWSGFVDELARGDRAEGEDPAASLGGAARNDGQARGEPARGRRHSADVRQGRSCSPHCAQPKAYLVKTLLTSTAPLAIGADEWMQAAR